MKMAEPRALVVDDDQNDRFVLARILSRLGLKVVETSSADEALPIARTQFFAVMFVDIKMPGMNGIELIDHLRPLHPRTPIVIITGTMNVEQLKKHTSSGILVAMKPLLVKDARALLEQLKVPISPKATD